MLLIRRLVPTALLAALFLAAALPARAETASDWARNEQVQVRLISAATGAGARNEVRLGLQFQMAPGWKIYWRSPGDAGYPPSLDWSSSDNVANMSIAWPAPHRFEILGLTTFGYKDEVVLPVTVTLHDPARPVRIETKVSYLTCADVCIPHEAVLRLELPAGPAQSASHAHTIARYENLVPGSGERLGLAIRSVDLRRRGTERFLAVEATSENGFENPDLIVEGLQRVRLSEPEVSLSEGGRRALLLLPLRDQPQAGAEAVTGRPLTLTLLTGGQGAEFVAAAREGPPLARAEGPGLGWGILLIAFLGGLILNLMPCVLPVLSLKVLSVVGLGGAEKPLIRRKFVATAGGIVASFLALAGLLIGLRAGGATIGWGIQFQEPVFLIAMALVLTFFAANLFGFFKLNLPASFGTALAAAGAKGGKKGLAGDFFTGAFATLLATPCSAPFVGTAVGFALAGSAGAILTVFAVMGLGLAAPYLLVAAVPALAARLPKPGPWMARLEIVLGVALLLTVVWLVSVLWAQMGQAALAVGGLALAILLVFGLARHGPVPRRAAAGLAILLAAAGFAVPSQLGSPGPGTSFVYGDHWRPWREAAIAEEVRAGRTVFVDVTAEWCITCQVNKQLVLSREEVAARLAEDGTVAMVADWTRPDDAIAQYLASFGRYGIPFNVVYGPGAPDGIVLPEILTVDAVVSALDRASGRPSAARGE